jgi:hypothetical protein
MESACSLSSTQRIVFLGRMCFHQSLHARGLAGGELILNFFDWLVKQKIALA